MTRSVFVARERQLQRLDGFFRRALAGQGLVCFVTGEAGSGKTALVTEFARRAQQEHEDLVVAVGQSDAQTGKGDAYLPFREVLGQLTGDVEAKLAQGAITQENAGRLRTLLAFSGRALVEVGPDLIEIFVPWVGLATRAAAFAADKIGWLDRLEQLVGQRQEREEAVPSGIEQDHIFEQYTNVLIRLAEQQPLLLVLDDLQWADAASMGLLFRLGRRIGGSRILIVGTYRPEEVALGRPSTRSGQVERHPLEKVLAEFKRYFGDIWVDLEQARETEGRHFVDAMLDTEPNRLGERFRETLHHHTDGHPLFTIELLRDMQERGDLVQDREGYWVEGPALDWAAFPARVEGVIEERIGRLKADLQEALTVGSVEGERFTAEVIARVRAANARQLVRQLSGELEKQHRLVSAQGVRRLDAQRLSLYQFQHNLFQSYLYNRLDDAERAYLHEDVGLVLEELYGDQAGEIAVQLARHFEEAGLVQKAVRYLRSAGEQAATRYANEEAEDYVRRALDLVPTDGTSEWATERYALLRLREKVYDLQGARHEQRQDLKALAELAEALDEDGRRAEVALRQAHYDEVTGDYEAALAASQAAISLGQAVGDSHKEAAGRITRARALWRQGECDAAQAQLRQALALARSAGMQRIEAGSLRDLGIVSWLSGDYDQARAHTTEALQIYHELGDRRGESAALGNLGILCALQGDHAQAQELFEKVLHVSLQLGDRQSEGNALNSLGNLAEDRGDFSQAERYYQQALQLRREIGDRQGQATVLGNLGSVYKTCGDYARAREFLQHDLQIRREIHSPRGEAIVLVNLSYVFNQLGEPESARAYGQEALDIAREVADPSTEAHALTALGRAYEGLGRLAEAASAHRQCLTLRQELGEHFLTVESLAGLASVALAADDLPAAQAHVDEILSYLEDRTLEGTEEPFRIYLTCYRVLHANDDPRAEEILAEAHALLQEQATQISDEAMRRTFLENVPAHRAIVQAATRI
jgi:adenylate cyclase